MAWQDGSSDPEKVWLYLIEVCGYTKAGAAGVLGNMKNESGVIPNRVQMDYGWGDDEYTSAVDSGSYGNFVYDSIGYGLVQFTYWALKQQVLDKANELGKSVGDIEVQLECLKDMMQGGYPDLNALLKSSNDIRECCVAFLFQYENPLDKSIAVQNLRTQSAQEFYDQFEGLSTSTGGSSGPGGTVIDISYDRAKDPLLLEFGYGNISDPQSANIGHSMLVTKEVDKYPVSAMNMADLLNDIFDIWGFKAGTGGSGGEQAAGEAKMQSGKVVTSGTVKEVPDSVPQTGLIASYTGYDRSWAQGTTQRTIYDLWVGQGKPSQYSVAMLSGYYLIAPGRYFSNSAGDILQVFLDNGYSFMAMVADTKGADTQCEYGHPFGGAYDIIEWENATTSQDSITQGLKDWGVYGCNVTKMINFGTWFQ